MPPHHTVQQRFGCAGHVYDERTIEKPEFAARFFLTCADKGHKWCVIAELDR